MKIPTIEVMLEAGLHFGHKTSKWHPKMKPYIFTQRKNVHIIDLEKTSQMLEQALTFLSTSVHEGKSIVLVGTKEQVKDLTKQAGVDADISYVNEKWIGGLLTNFPVVKKMITKYKNLVEQKKTGKLTKYTKKEQLEFDKEIERLEKKVGGLVNLNSSPDVVFIWDIKKEKTALKEAFKKGVKVVAVCDTNSNPSGIDYIIPANDDATKGATMIFKLIQDVVLEARKNKK